MLQFEISFMRYHIKFIILTNGYNLDRIISIIVFTKSVGQAMV